MPPTARTFSDIRLLNGSTGDPVLFVDYPGKDDALLFDAGDTSGLTLERLADLEAVFLTHHHLDHVSGLDRVLRANLDGDKVLHVFGPVSTIRRVYSRIQSYDIQFFPFQKVVVQVHELEGTTHREACLECVRKFPPPEITESPWKGPVAYQTEELTVEAAPTEHTTPGLAYALVEASGYHPDPEKMAEGALRPGRWVGEVLKLLREEAAPETVLEIQGGQFKLGPLAEQYFVKSRGARVAFVTDTLWSPAVKPGLLRLANKAQRLYCDSFYAHAELKQAQKYRHMTATQAAEFALTAKVERLILMHLGSRYAGRFEELVEEARALFPRASAELN